MVCRHLFWTLLLSRFKQFEISRERVKYVLDFYEHIKSSLTGEDKLFRLMAFLNATVEMFGKV